METTRKKSSMTMEKSKGEPLPWSPVKKWWGAVLVKIFKYTPLTLSPESCFLGMAQINFVSWICTSKNLVQRRSPVRVKFWQATRTWNSIGCKMATDNKDRLKLWQQKGLSQIQYLNSDSDMASTLICKTTGFEIQTRNLCPPSQREPAL